MAEDNKDTHYLKVLEAYTRDVGRGLARIDYDTMDSLGASTGDAIEIKGKRRTVAAAFLSAIGSLHSLRL
jgi:transitional endoplasmic reticulum ATPase